MPILSLLLALVAGGGLLRFWNLQNRGFLYWDEAKFALEGERMQAALLFLVRAHTRLEAGKAVGTAKPAHALLLGIAYTIFGVHDWAALAVPALCSTVSVLLTYVVARRLFSATVALVAAGLFAVSEYEVIYARSALSESDATMFFLVAVILWLDDDANELGRGFGRLAASTIIFGLAFTVNYRLLVFIGTVAVIDLFRALKRHNACAFCFRCLVWTGAFLFPLIWQILGILFARHGLLLFRNELTGRPTTYVSEALYQVHGGKQAVFRFAPLPYIQWFAVREGPIVSGLVAFGLAVAAYTRSSPRLIIATIVATPYIVYTFAPFIVPRNLEAALPFVSIVAATAIVDVAGLLTDLRVRRLLPAILFVVSLLVGAWMSLRLTSARSGFAATASYARSRGQSRLLTTSEDMVFYFPGRGETCNAPALPLKFSALKWYVGSGYRYVVIERHKSSVGDFIQAHSPLAASFLVTGPLDIGENLINSENTHPPDGSDPPDMVLVYDIHHLKLPRWVRAATHPRRCTREIVT